MATSSQYYVKRISPGKLTKEAMTWKKFFIKKTPLGAKGALASKREAYSKLKSPRKLRWTGREEA